MIPKPHYSLINTSRGDDPAVVVVNTSLRAFEQSTLFAWHLKITVECLHITESGMPTADELPILETMEDRVTALLQANDNAAFFARVTCRGVRELVYRVQEPDRANELLQSLVDEESSGREWDFHMEFDPGWMLAQPELKLPERDPRIN
jgi:hypothetical protein